MTLKPTDYIRVALTVVYITAYFFGFVWLAAGIFVALGINI